jgi:hypothetical protein
VKQDANGPFFWRLVASGCGRSAGRLHPGCRYKVEGLHPTYRATSAAVMVPEVSIAFAARTAVFEPQNQVVL